jgi:hypothetical protein
MTASRLGKLLRLALGSDVPGEAAAAIAAINRELQASGSDYHALAAVIERGAPIPAQTHKERSWRDIRKWCADHAAVLSERDQQFLASLARWRGQLTDKQLKWLLDIERRIRS